MSTFFDDEINCSCCGGKVKVTCVGSTNSFGGCDLDTRPAPMQRWTMGYWIQACPHCGYDTNILLMTAHELKAVAEKWKEKHADDEEVFPLGFFKQCGKFDISLISFN